VILLVGEQAEQLDDPLYDDKTSGEISIEELARVIEISVANKRRVLGKVRSGLSRGRAY
jgi:hypothetical protein